MNAPLKIGLASVLAIATAMPALAQPYDPDRYQPAPQYEGSPYRPTQQYQDDQARYQRDRADYQDRKDAYDANRQNYEDKSADYRAARANYERRRSDWARARADYDARYGYGAYVRVYGAEPVWDEGDWRQTYYVAPAATYYGRDTTYTTTCRSNNNSAVTAGIIGALAGAALGSNIAAGGHRGDGAVLGGVVGAGIGASIGHANDKYKCDNRGPYYSYNETIAYREDRRFRSGNHDYAYYNRMRCRLAPAPVNADGRDYRYVRVCPDSSGRYRITG